MKAAALSDCNTRAPEMFCGKLHRRYWFSFERPLDAGSADVLVRNEREARRSSASFARGADEDVRAPALASFANGGIVLSLRLLRSAFEVA